MYFKKVHKMQEEIDYFLSQGTYRIIIRFNSKHIKYSVVSSVYEILKKFGYTRKGNKR